MSAQPARLQFARRLASTISAWLSLSGGTSASNRWTPSTVS
jgi:hypothetical protein